MLTRLYALLPPVRAAQAAASRARLLARLYVAMSQAPRRYHR